MKLLENATLEAINSALVFDVHDCEIVGRIESYSCKSHSQDKKLYKSMVSEPGTSPHDLLALSPPLSSLGSNERQLCDTITVKTLFYLIGTLNASHPDYDFTSARGSDFSRHHVKDARNEIDNRLLATARDAYGAMKNDVWAAINNEIVLNECEVYSYNSDLDSDPYSEDGCIWSFNYFFFNRRLKRILFLTCKASSSDLMYSEWEGPAFDMEMDDDFTQ